MLVGIDVTHPSPGSKEGAPSIAAVVASFDEQLSSYPGDVVPQESRQEMVSGLKRLISDRLKFFRQKNKKLPSKIIVYRDGVSESQFHIVLDKEYSIMKEAFDDLYGAPAKHPKVTIIVS
jgi:eukaryotic translation initiation factor 2C